MLGGPGLQLRQAALNNDAPAALREVEAGVDVDHANAQGETALYTAAK